MTSTVDLVCDSDMGPLTDRSEFSTLGSFTYLNQASLGLISQPVVDAMSEFLEQIGRHGNTYMSDDDETEFLSDLRNRASRLFQADAGQIAILSSASELLGQIPLILDLGDRTRVLAVSSDFPAVTRPWLRLAESGGCVVKFVDDNPDADLTADLITRIDSQTALVTVGSVQYATGTVVDIPRLRAATASAGARLVVDVTQEAGTGETAVGSWNADIVVSSGYKWLGGHGGAAIGVIDRDLLEETPALPGWMSAPNPFEFDAKRLLLAGDARRYTQSTISYASVAGLTVAIGQLLDIGLDAIQHSAEHLANSLIDQLHPHGWHPLRDKDDPGASAHIISLEHRDKNIDRVLHRLRSDNIVAGGRGGRLRISIAHYNSEEDIAALVGCLSHI